VHPSPASGRAEDYARFILAAAVAKESRRREKLGALALQLGEQFRQKLRAALVPFEIVKEVRGMGMLSGVEFQASDAAWWKAKEGTE